MNKKYLIPLLGVFALGLVLAASYYAFVSVNLDITQPISVSGELSPSLPCEAGETCLGEMIRVDNSGSSDRTVRISDDSIPEIEVSYVGRLDLENKDQTTWEVLEDGMAGELYYTIFGDEFGYKFMAEGLNDEEYVLLYYADDDPRFENWGGNPALLLASGTAVGGALELEGALSTGDLPQPQDWNKVADPNYCDLNNGIDDYEHCYGAKIWLVPASDYDPVTESLIAWNGADYLFETDLVYYFENTDGDYEILSGSFVEFYPLFTVDPYLPSGSYNVDITVA